LGPVITDIDDHRQVGQPSWYVTSHPGQLSLAILPWIGTMDTAKGWRVNDTLPDIRGLAVWLELKKWEIFAAV